MNHATDLFTLTVQPSDYESEREKHFSENSTIEWVRQPEYNMMFLRAQEQYANDMLQAKGHLFLNEILDSLGLPRTRLGQLLGWTRAGSEFITFGVDFESGFNGDILLHFNFEGIIYDKVDF